MIDVPELSQWCVNSLPLDSGKLADPGYRNGAVNGLFDLILVPAQNAQILSTGIPFISTIQPSPPLDGNSTSTAFVVLTACAVVKSSDPPAGGRAFHRTLGKAQGYAVLCATTDVKECRGKIIDKAITDRPATARGSADSWEWRTTQALSTMDSADNLIASVSDYSLRPMTRGPVTAAPVDAVVILAFPPGSEPKITLGP